MQLYFYETDENLTDRSKRSSHLDANLIKVILQILENNLYVRVFS